MGEVVVVVDEEMDTRPICDTQTEAEGQRGERTVIIWLCLVDPNSPPLPRLSPGPPRLRKGTEE